MSQHLSKCHIVGNHMSWLMSSLPGKASIMFVESRGSAKRFNMRFLKLSMVNQISKSANHVFYLSVYPLIRLTLQTRLLKVAKASLEILVRAHGEAIGHLG